MDLKNLLNKEQYEAATTIQGQLLILAGAGSGKTRVLTHRIAHMVKDLAIFPSQILAITFTNKAAGEMRERVRVLVGDEVDRMWISTFHSSCVRILRREIDKLGYKKDFTIYDSYDQKTLMKQCMKELNINDKEITENEVLNKIGKQKDNLISPEQFKRENEHNFKENKIADLYLLYQKKLRSNNALDFDDLIYKTVELFKKNPEVLEFYQRKFKYIMIDEYQDTNKSQYEFVRLLASLYKNICVVGDDDQCIYAWRGADIRNILDFEKDYPSTKVIKLEQNYRSKSNILDAANSVIKNNTERKSKVLRTDSEPGDKIKLYRASSDMEEGDFVAAQIKRLINEEGRNYKDFAILYRTNNQSRVFEEMFIRRNIPYRIVGGLKFYDRKEIKDILAYLKLINNPSDDVSLQRIINVPKRNIGDTTVDKMISFASSVDDSLYNVLLDIDNVPGLATRTVGSINKFTLLIEKFIVNKDAMRVSDIIKTVLEDTGYMEELKKSTLIEDESRIENLKELVSDAVEFENTAEDKSLSAFLEKVTLVADIDNYDNDADSVVLMTVHSAKGLEFPIVFMVGMENGIFPGNASFNDPKEMEESRRLCYVGITRARERLFMTSAEVRRVFGKTMAFAQSDFITEIAISLLDNLSTRTQSYRKEEKSPYGYQQANNNPHTLRNMNIQQSDAAMDSAVKQISDIIEAKSSNEKRVLTEVEATLGRKVKHSQFGVGTIVRVTKDDGVTKLTIAFDNMGIKNLILSIAPLELL